MLTGASSRQQNLNVMAPEEEGGETQANSRKARALARATSYVTDEGETFARELPRQHFLSWIKVNRRGSNEHKGHDGNSRFVAEILLGLYRRAPDKAKFVLRERRAGTMTEMAESRALPTRPEDVRRRQEHLECGIVEMSGVRSGGRGGLGIVREAFLQEFRDLYEIIGSIEARKWDACKGDVLGLFEWFKVIENFVRVYLTVTQRGYVVAGRGEWGIREKKKVVKAAERVAEMKRMMVAMDERCGEMVGRLRRRAEEFVEEMMGFLEEESRVVGRVLERGFDDMMKKMIEGDNGRQVGVLLGRGTRDREWGMKMGGWRAARRVKDRHWDYVEMFVLAEREYRAIYGKLGAEMDGRSDRV